MLWKTNFIFSVDKIFGGFLFFGQKEIGKFEAALDLVFQTNKIQDLDLKQQIAAGLNPEVVILEPQIEETKTKTGAVKKRKKNISLEEVKAATSRFIYKTSSDNKKFILIRQAEKLTPEAANSLLKILEEPPDFLITILITDKLGEILPTLRSRLKLARFIPFEKEELEKILKEKINQKEKVLINKEVFDLGEFQNVTENELSKAINAAQGSFKRAIYFLRQPENLALEESWRNQFRMALRGGLLEGMKLAEELSDDKEKLLLAIEQWIFYLREFLISKIKENADSKIIQKIFTILNRLLTLQKEIEKTNANAKLAVENFFVQIS